MSAVMEKDTTQLVFAGSWEVGTNLPGAPLLRLDLTLVTTPPTSVTGHARITQAISPPLDQVSRVTGEFHTIATPTDTLHIVTLQGYPLVVWPPHSGIGPVLLPNLDARLILSNTWRDGTASYRYTTTPGGEWHTVDSVPVTYVGQPATLDS
jgi:hypothetical protein